jgi:hypothetical protein
VTRSLTLTLPGSHDGVWACQNVLWPRNVAPCAAPKDWTALQLLRLLVPRLGSVASHLHEFSATMWLKYVLRRHASAPGHGQPQLLVNTHE